MRRIAILAEGSFDRQNAKTAVGVLRYSQDTVVAIIDSTRAGQDAAVSLAIPLAQGAACPSSPILPRHCRSSPTLCSLASRLLAADCPKPGALRCLRAGEGA